MAGSREWVLLAYRMPREPSTPRIAVWRKLRRLGVVQIVDGLVAVPDSAANAEHLGWIANDVLDADGEATLWTARLSSAKQERELVARLTKEVADAYRAFTATVEDLERNNDGVGVRERDRLTRKLRAIVRRDHLGASGRDRAERALKRLSRSAEAV